MTHLVSTQIIERISCTNVSILEINHPCVDGCIRLVQLIPPTCSLPLAQSHLPMAHDGDLLSLLARRIPFLGPAGNSVFPFSLSLSLSSGLSSYPNILCIISITNSSPYVKMIVALTHTDHTKWKPITSLNVV
jgi:hypothetical protein